MTDSERLVQIWDRIVEALQEVVREYEITQDELHLAAAFLNRVGRENVGGSLVDVALAMTSVDVEARGRGQGGTRSNLEGPFYTADAPLRPDGVLLTREPSADATFLTLSGRLSEAGTGSPVAGAVVDVWQADEHGIYDNDGFHLRGKVLSAADGTYQIQTVVPVDYAQHENDAIGDLFRAMGKGAYRAAHIHVRIFVDGVERLTTQIFMDDSPRLDADYVVGAVSDDLIVQLGPGASHDRRVARFDFAVP